ncbi:MAG: transcription antitermination factor NusB [Pseudomonadota bacterium]
MNVHARRKARHYALQALYQWQISGTPPKEIVEQFIANQIDKKIDLEYFTELVNGVPANSSAIDAEMSVFLKRPLEELDPIELAIMRMGIYEFLFRLDIPYRVVINEALELTKKFGSVEGFKFVNGVLDQVARKIRSVEVAADVKTRHG